MSITKKFLKSKPVCKVTFKLKKSAVNGADTVALSGDFNNWEAAAMKKMKSGDFSLTLDLESGREYQFRYLVNGKEWLNDPEADAYVASPYGDSENCVISV